MKPAQSPYLITAPTQEQRRYVMSVALPLRPREKYHLFPWIRLTADCASGDVLLAAGIRCERKGSGDEEDGA